MPAYNMGYTFGNYLLLYHGQFFYVESGRHNYGYPVDEPVQIQEQSFFCQPNRWCIWRTLKWETGNVE